MEPPTLAMRYRNISIVCSCETAANRWLNGQLKTAPLDRDQATLWWEEVCLSKGYGRHACVFFAPEKVTVGLDCKGMWIIPLHYGIPKRSFYEKAHRRATSVHQR